MPGYRVLSERFGGDVADIVRFAQEREQEGNIPEALRLYESALVSSPAHVNAFPPFAVGRLAQLLRRLARYDDEVDLLERYTASHSDETLRSRYDARLSKARALAAKHSPKDSGALASVRAIKSSEESRRLRLGNPRHYGPK
jgi:hypothetical protein